MALLTGCIHNDLPYPVVVPNITSMSVQDAVEVDIDYEARVVTVYVSETTDLTKVVIQSVDYDVDITKPSIQLLGVHDLMVHSYGPGSYFASAHIEMDAKINVLVCHDIMDQIERDFKAKVEM